MNPSTLHPRIMTRQPRPTVADIVGPIEKVALDAQGAFKARSDSCWKLGRLILTDKRFVLLVNDHIKVQVPLDEVVEVKTERKPFVLASTATVRLSWDKQDSRFPRKLWLITKDIKTWRDALFQMTVLEVTDQTIERIASAVDADCAALLRYVWQQGHAETDELAELIDVTSHSDVLEKIHKTVNPAAAGLLGCSVLVFRRCWKAPGKSEPIRDHWWIAGKRKPVPARPAVHVNVFEEPGHVDVVTVLPGVRDNDVMLNVRNGRLIISAASDTEKFHEETNLPAGTRTEAMTWKMNNDTLLVRFGRSSGRQSA